MYPKLSDLINDWFGTDIVLPIQSYGFFLALAFLSGAFFLYQELMRKEREGLISPQKKKVQKGKPASTGELISVFVISFLVTFKITGALLNYNLFANNPQDFMLSGEGSWPGGLLIACAYTTWFFYSKKKKEMHPPVWEDVTIHAQEQTWPIVFVAIVFGILGSKVFHWFENWEEFSRNPLDALLSFSGMSFYGGLIVAAAAVGLYAKRQGIRWWIMADSVAPSLILSYGIGRIGCHVAGDGDWGIVNTLDKPGWLSFFPDWLWSYKYPHNIINEGIPIPACSGPHCFQLAEGVFPTPVYETFMALLIFLFLWRIRKRPGIPGMLTAIYLMLNGMERFFIERIRVNNLFDFLGMKVTQAEVISVILFLTGLALLIILWLKQKKTTS
ncbi:MAG: prolipoprotein diacylglyceryl transferase [Bacteroidales bacterium]|nr:prolipoprotein diacylglyceryl transferase [Bacteroidales bacterium]